MKKHGDIELVGHVYLARSMDHGAERFIRLVEALDRAGASQHVIVANDDLAKRVGVCPAVSVGPVTGSAVMAYCLMPRVDVVHAHGDQAGHSALLLALTRSIPYVMTLDLEDGETETRIQQAVLRRSKGRLHLGASIDAGKILRSYGRAVAGWPSRTLLV